jgi:hypothetical protein
MDFSVNPKMPVRVRLQAEKAEEWREQLAQTEAVTE